MAGFTVALFLSLPQGYLRTAKCHMMFGNPQLSITFYEKVLNLQPKNQQALAEVCVCV